MSNPPQTGTYAFPLEHLCLSPLVLMKPKHLRLSPGPFPLFPLTPRPRAAYAAKAHPQGRQGRGDGRAFLLPILFSIPAARDPQWRLWKCRRCPGKSCPHSLCPEQFILSVASIPGGGRGACISLCVVPSHVVSHTTGSCHHPSLHQASPAGVWAAALSLRTLWAWG